MDKLDRLGWAGGLAFRAFGTRVGIRVNQIEVLDRLESLLPPGWKPATHPVVDRLYSLRVGGASPKSRIRRYNLLYADMKRVGRSMDLDDVLEVLASDMHSFVAEASKTRIFTHAGGGAGLLTIPTSTPFSIPAAAFTLIPARSPSGMELADDSEGMRSRS